MAFTPEEMVIHEYNGVQYKIIDFQGYICWKKLKDGSFVVDPEYLEDFKTFKHIGQYNDKRCTC